MTTIYRLQIENQLRYQLKKDDFTEFRLSWVVLYLKVANHRFCIDCIELTGIFGILLCKILASWYF